MLKFGGSLKLLSGNAGTPSQGGMYLSDIKWDTVCACVCVLLYSSFMHLAKFMDMYKCASLLLVEQRTFPKDNF